MLKASEEPARQRAPQDPLHVWQVESRLDGRSVYEADRSEHIPQLRWGVWNMHAVQGRPEMVPVPAVESSRANVGYGGKHGAAVAENTELLPQERPGILKVLQDTQREDEVERSGGKGKLLPVRAGQAASRADRS